jgi:hypothetical protein
MGCAERHGLEETAVDKKKKNAWALIAPATTAAYLWMLSGCNAVDPIEPTIEYATELKLGAAPVALKRDLRAGVYVVEVRERDIDIRQIEDAPTAQFMEKFYPACRETGRAADALRIAQLDARRAAARPVWSSFVVRANAFP